MNVENLSHKSGIYCIQSLSNNRVYIGSAVDIKNRMYVHIKHLKKNKHSNVHLQNTWNKYGEDDLIIKTIIFCEKKDLISYEQKIIELYKQNIGWEQMFNICPTAGSSFGKECSEETKNKISTTKLKKHSSGWNLGLTSKTDERVRKYGEKQQGKKKWEINEHPKGMLGKTHSEETKQQISLSCSILTKTRHRDAYGHFIKESLV